MAVLRKAEAELEMTKQEVAAHKYVGSHVYYCCFRRSHQLLYMSYHCCSFFV